MNIRLQTDLEFMAAVYMENSLKINNYSLSVQLCTNTSEEREINIAMDRLKIFVQAELADAVFVNQEESGPAEMLALLGANVVTLPEEPVDQIIGLMLYCKLTAIMEDRMIIENLDISSSLGDNVIYLHNEEDALGPFQQTGWWHAADITHSDIEFEDDSDRKNVVKVPNTGWSFYGLCWNQGKKNTQDGTVVVGNFSQNAKQ